MPEQIVEKKKGFSRPERLAIVAGLVIFLGYMLFTYTSLGGTLMNMPLRVQPKVENGLVGYWSFDTVYSASSTQEVRDDSGQGNHGNIIGNASTSDKLLHAVSAGATNTFHMGSSPRVVFVSESKGYLFDVDGAGTCVMASTTDSGVTWSATSTVDSVNTADCMGIAVWYDGWTPGLTPTSSTSTKIHIATIDTGVDDIYYTSLDVQNEALSGTLLTATQAATLTTAGNYVSIARTADSKLYVTVNDASDSFMLTCSANCAGATTNWNEVASTTAPLADDPSLLIPLPATTTVMKITNDVSAEDFLSNIYSTSTNTWQATSTIDANAPDNTTYDAQFGAAVDDINNKVYLVYAADVNDYVTQDHDIRTASYDTATNAWTAKTAVITNSSGGITDAKVSFDENKNTVYAVYTVRSTIGTAATARTYFKTSVDGMTTWSPEYGPIDVGASDWYGGANVNIMGDRIFNVRHAATGIGTDQRWGNTVSQNTGLYDFSEGKVGQGYRFDGVDDYIDAGTGAVFDMGSGDLSVVAWFRHTGASGADSDYVITKGAQSAGGKRYGININTSDELSCSLDDDTTDEGFSYTGVSVSDSNWHHAACVRRGNTAYLYLDGVEVATNDITGLGSLNDGESMKIGASETNAGVTTGFFNGNIDEPRVYNRALGAEEVTRIYHIGATTKVNTTINTQPSLLNGLVGHWTFDGEDVFTTTARVTSEITDRSGNGNNGDWLSHASTTVAGRIGQAIQFDGQDDYISITSDTELQLGSSDWSTSFWAKLATTSGNQFVINKRTDGNDKEYEVYLNAATRDVLVECEDAGSGGQSTSVNGVWKNNEWFHVAVSFNRSTFTPTYYVNGQLIAEEGNTLTVCDPPSGAVVKIGGRSTTGPFFEGLIDDVRLYNRKITAAEAAELYRLGATSKINTSINTQPSLQNSLVGLYTFDGKDMPLGQVNDRSGNGNNGSTIAFASTTSYIPGRIGQALTFNGSTQYVSLGASTNLIQNASASSISLWAKANPAGSGTRRMVGISDGISNSSRFSFLLTSGNLITVIVKAGDAEGGFTLNSSNAFTGLGEWHHFVAVIDYVNDTAKIYLDGVEQAMASQPTFTGTQTSNTSPQFAHIGTGPAASNFWDGGLDDVRFYNRALSVAEIQDLYSLGR